MSAQLRVVESYVPSVPANIPCSSEQRAVFQTNRAGEKSLEDVISIVTQSLAGNGNRPLRVNSRFTAASRIHKLKSGDSTRSIVIETRNVSRNQHEVYYKERVPLTAQSIGKTTLVRAHHLAVLASPEDKKALHDDIYNWLRPAIAESPHERVSVLIPPLKREPGGIHSHEVVGALIVDVKPSYLNGEERITLFMQGLPEEHARLVLRPDQVAKYEKQSLVGLWFVTNLHGDFDIYTPDRFRALFQEVE